MKIHKMGWLCRPIYVIVKSVYQYKEGKTMLKPLKRIAAVHDISGAGKCSLTVALPIISASGVECACLPTALLSTHTGEFENFTFRDLSDELLPIARRWHAEGLCFDGIYSGYLASPEQAELLKQVINELANEETIIICDPVMADHGSYYSGFDERMTRAFRELCSVADVITPNITEAALLTGLQYKQPVHERAYIEELLNALAELGPRVVALTGVHLTETALGTAVLDRETGKTHFSMRPARDGVFYGTGDIFASAFAALVVRGARLADACETATALVSESIERTVQRGTPRRLGVDFEGALANYLRTTDKMDFDEAAIKPKAIKDKARI